MTGLLLVHSSDFLHYQILMNELYTLSLSWPNQPDMYVLHIPAWTTFLIIKLGFPSLSVTRKLAICKNCLGIMNVTQSIARKTTRGPRTDSLLSPWLFMGKQLRVAFFCKSISPYFLTLDTNIFWLIIKMLSYLSVI